ncbi:hypothetical protein C475_18973 [Halosimplex carlsbadense 2-9-1]|uniref:Uncharacterized protein n=1 Tax=Halosimplex carlsbadense 2-9-1 TaxID=797114 RepID=M0CCS6_9EURY|nr:hypothetical protein [Halosimplex carlsbadense]ELZ21071.1 hypothetical protein C475_18973 [Halosimplex carlsbadense 2-9-1]
MRLELTITADKSELPLIVNALSTLEGDVDVSVDADGDDGGQIAIDLTNEGRYVLAAVQESPGSALRVIHRTVNELDGTPFEGYSQEDGWNDEREEVQGLLWSLKSEDLVRNDGQQWYPTDDAPTDVLQ